MDEEVVWKGSGTDNLLEALKITVLTSALRMGANLAKGGNAILEALPGTQVSHLNVKIAYESWLNATGTQ